MLEVSVGSFNIRGVAGLRRLAALKRQILGVSPFAGDCAPARVRIFQRRSGRPSLPFPHPWNYQQPIEILESYWWGAESELGPGRHNRYLDFPGFAPVLVTRDPGIIRAITTETGDGPSQFDRDTLPSTGIARATGTDTLLFANGPFWRKQRKAAASPFGKTALFQPEMFEAFAETLRPIVVQRLETLREHLRQSGRESTVVQLEPEIKAVMLELLTRCFFGAELPHEEVRNRYVPALERVIDHIVRDTILNKLGIPLRRLPSVTRSLAQVKEDYAVFDQLTDQVLAARSQQRCLWSKFKSEAPDEALRSNVKVFLAGALEATTSYASWVIWHLARDPASQERVYQEVKEIDRYTPEQLDGAKYLGYVLEETLRLTPSLYFLPRKASADVWVETADGRRMFIPSGTHILLDVWHANRHEDHWGVDATGYPALQFAPERWSTLAGRGRASKDFLHFGFGHGPRVCPGKHLGQLEVALVVGVIVKLFRFTSPVAAGAPKAGVSTKPGDGTRVELHLRQPSPAAALRTG